MVADHARIKGLVMSLVEESRSGVPGGPPSDTLACSRSGLPV
jgi:hypothetical protein